MISVHLLLQRPLNSFPPTPRGPQTCTYTAACILSLPSQESGHSHYSMALSSTFPLFLVPLFTSKTCFNISYLNDKNRFLLVFSIAHSPTTSFLYIQLATLLGWSISTSNLTLQNWTCHLQHLQDKFLFCLSKLPSIKSTTKAIKWASSLLSVSSQLPNFTFFRSRYSVNLLILPHPPCSHHSLSHCHWVGYLKQMLLLVPSICHWASPEGFLCPTTQQVKNTEKLLSFHPSSL